MSYLHCPVCSRAYNIAAQSSCPYCPVQATPVDPTEDILTAAESLARAISRASEAERAAAAARMERLALTDGSGAPGVPMLRSIRNAIVPVPPPPPRPSRIETVARSLLARASIETVARSLLARLPQPAPRLLGDGLRRLRRALA